MAQLIHKQDTSTGFDDLGKVLYDELDSTTITSLTVPDATTTIKGKVVIGEGIDVGSGATSGLISVPNATKSSKGKVQIGDGINVNAGNITVSLYNGLTYTGLPPNRSIMVNVNTNQFQFTAGVLTIKSNVFANYSHTHTAANITDFVEAAQSAVGKVLTDTATIDFTYANNQITADVKSGVFAPISHSHTSTGISDFVEAAQDAIGLNLLDSNTVNFTYNDAALSNQFTAEVIPDNSTIYAPTGQPLQAKIDSSEPTIESVLSAGLKVRYDDSSLKKGSTGLAVYYNSATLELSGGLNVKSGVFALDGHTHLASTLTGFTEAVQDVVGNVDFLKDSSTIDFTYDDDGATLTAAVLYDEDTLDINGHGLYVKSGVWSPVGHSHTEVLYYLTSEIVPLTEGLSDVKQTLVIDLAGEPFIPDSALIDWHDHHKFIQVSINGVKQHYNAYMLGLDGNNEYKRITFYRYDSIVVNGQSQYTCIGVGHDIFTTDLIEVTYLTSVL